MVGDRALIPLHGQYFSTKARKRALEHIDACLDTGYTGEGQQVARLERRIADLFRVDVDRVVATSSATAGLHILERMTPDGEVAVPAVTCLATVAPWYLARRRTWWLAPGDDGLVDPKHATCRLPYSYRISAAVLVDWAGQPSHTEAFVRRAGRGPWLVVDAAQHVLGRSPRVGAGNALTLEDTWPYADAVVLSLQSIKGVTAGDGGVILLPPGGRYAPEVARRLRWFGLDRSVPGDRHQQSPERIGGKWHLNDLAASVALAHLGDASEQAQNRSGFSAAYDSALASHPVLHPRTWTAENAVPWIYTARVREGFDRDAVVRWFGERRIQVGPLHRDVSSVQPLLDVSLNPSAAVDPAVLAFAQRHVCLPIHPRLAPPDVQRVLDAIAELREEASSCLR